MWTKISNALKPKQGSEQESEPSVAQGHSDVLASVYEQHPNMSVFHDTETDAPVPTPSPPGSPSKHGRRGMFKRTAKMPKGDDDESARAPPPLKLSIGLPKKVRSHLQLKGNGSQTSLTRGSVDTTRPSVDILRSPQEYASPSLESVQGVTSSVVDVKYGSVRSILRDPKTPGTGQNVRFFSRDAFKAMSPDASAASSEHDPVSFVNRLHKIQIEKIPESLHPPRPSAMELFSPLEGEVVSTTPPSDALSFMAPPPIPHTSNIFELSDEHELPTIPGFSIVDAANDFAGGDNGSIKGTVTSTPFRKHDGKRSTDEQPNQHDRSISFSFGQNLFHSISKSSLHGSLEAKPPNVDRSSSLKSKSRNRALSDTIFFQSAPKAKKPLEADINDGASASLIVSESSEPDPFRADATTYYTPQTMIPTTPPGGQTMSHIRSMSREEDLIWSLRTQLALQQELRAQFEIDLNARDDLVRALNARLDNAEKENDKRKGVLRSWKKKAAELEKMCRHLEEEVDHSRQESLERSIMDEASGEALRQLHKQISQLERERGAVANREASERREQEALSAALKARDHEVEEAIEAREVLQREHEELDVQYRNERERADNIMHALEEATKGREALERDHEKLDEQWKNEREHADHLTQALQAREELVANLESEQQFGYENISALEETVKQRDAEIRTLSQRLSHLTQMSQEYEDLVANLESERKFSSESISRLEENVKQRDVEIRTLSQCVVQRETEKEELREQLTKLQREQVYESEKSKRELHDAVKQEKEAREQFESMIKEKAESDVMLGSLKERVGTLKDEVERLRRQIHDHQQESADKEVKILQLTKQRFQDKEDLNGLNIALDSKQQELELLKRRLGMRGTAGSTPAQPSKTQRNRRESTVSFSTPTSRPSSALSDVSKDGLKDRKVSETPSALTKPGLSALNNRPSLSALNKSARVNAAAVSLTSRVTGSMGPPPAKTTRSSLTGTPTPATLKLPSSLLRSTTTRPHPSTPTTSSMRRASGSLLSSSQKSQIPHRRLSAAATPSEQGEKENMDDAPSEPTPSGRWINPMPA